MSWAPWFWAFFLKKGVLLRKMGQNERFSNFNLQILSSNFNLRACFVKLFSFKLSKTCWKSPKSNLLIKHLFLQNGAWILIYSIRMVFTECSVTEDSFQFLSLTWSYFSHLLFSRNDIAKFFFENEKYKIRAGRNQLAITIASKECVFWLAKLTLWKRLSISSVDIQYSDVDLR